MLGTHWKHQNPNILHSPPPPPVICKGQKHWASGVNAASPHWISGVSICKLVYQHLDVLSGGPPLSLFDAFL
jgi:hypothetical protein